MITVRLSTLLKKIIPAILSTLMVFSFPSCTKSLVFMTSTVVPAANGVVKVKRDKNKNYAIQVLICDLAEVHRLQGSKLTYVVWMVSEKERTENIGQLKSKSTFITKQLKATLKTVSPSNPKEIFITDENDGNVQYPIGQVVLSKDRF